MALHDLKFDGEGESPAAPHNNVSGIPQHGTPAWEAYVKAEAMSRAAAGSGINPQRARTLAKDKAAATKEGA